MLGKGGVISLVGAGGKTSLMFRLANELALAGQSVLTTTTTKIYVPLTQQSANLILCKSVSRMLEMAQAALEEQQHITAAAEKLPDQGKLRGFTPADVQDIWNSNQFRWIIVEADGAAGRPLKAPGEHEPVVGVDPGVNNSRGSTNAGYYDILGRRYYVGVRLDF